MHLLKTISKYSSLISILIISSFLSLLAPFGLEYGYFNGIKFWLIMVSLGFFCFKILILFFSSLIKYTSLSKMVKFILIFTVCSLLTSLVISMFMNHFFNDEYGGEFLSTYFRVVIITIFIGFISFKYYDFTEKWDTSLTSILYFIFLTNSMIEKRPVVLHPVANNLLIPLPFQTQKKELTGILQYIKKDGHYMHVVTDQDSNLILFRMKDAIELLKDYDGFLINRSYWVSRNSIQKIQKTTTKLELELFDQEIVSVSRPKIKEFMGWYNSTSI